jgi:DnaD/phage-associated family protein
MPDANGEFVKVYLYLLRNLQNHSTDCSVSAIADCFNHTEKDVLRALKYWERMHLLLLEYGADKALCGIKFLTPLSSIAGFSSGVGTAEGAQTALEDAAPAPENVSAAAGISNPTGTPDAGTASNTAAVVKKTVTAAPAVISKTTSRRDYSLEEVKNFRQDPNISELFFIIETYLKHPMASTDINTVLYWYDELHFSTELIVYLVEYCISEGHSSMHYMDKVALRWSEDHITNVTQAKENAAERSKYYYGVMKAMGITGRRLVDAEVALIRKWTGDYGFDMSLIQEACSRTIAATGQPNFKYADSILTNWNKGQVHSLEDVKQLDAEFSKKKAASSGTLSAGTTVTVSRNKFNNFDQRDYDYDQLERMALTTSVQ